MKMRVFWMMLLAAAAAHASQADFSFERKYKVGEADRYAYKMSMEVEQAGSVDLTTDMTHTVKKVYENGDADIEIESANTKILINGQEQKGESTSSKIVMRVNKFGIKQKSESKSGSGGAVGDLMFAFDKPMTIRQQVEFERIDPDNPKKKSVGTAMLESVEKGVARIEVSATITTEGRATPQKIRMTALFDAATSKPMRYDGTISGFSIGGDGGPDMKVNSASFSIVRKK